MTAPPLQTHVISAATTTTTSNSEYLNNGDGADGAKRVDKPASNYTLALDKYRVVPRAKTPIRDDEIRIASDGSVPRYVTYALQLFMRQARKGVTIKATGTAISVAITLAEIIKRRIPNLHQVNTIGVTTISDTFEPLEEGLEEVVRERVVAFIEILLTSDVSSVDVTAPGYQPPIDQSLVKTVTVEDIVATRSRGGRGGGGYYRGGRGRGGARGRGSVRGRGFRRNVGALASQEGDVPNGEPSAEEPAGRSGGARKRGGNEYAGRGGHFQRGGRAPRGQPQAQRLPAQA